VTDENRFNVLVSTDRGLTWKRHAGIIAASSDTAIKRVREANLEHYGDLETLFHATQRFNPRKWDKQMVEKYGLVTVELDDTIVTDDPKTGEPG
jgi:hypothetical protein